MIVFATIVSAPINPFYSSLIWALFDGIELMAQEDDYLIDLENLEENQEHA